MKNMSYQIKSFMWQRLSLGGSHLLVYAVIYSFSQGGDGSFFGSHSFLSEITGLSVSTVKRTLHSLLDMGLIEKLTPGGRVVYRSVITDDADIIEDTDIVDEIEGPCECDTPEPRKEDNTINKSAREKQGERVNTVKHTFLSLGKDGIIQMTNEQYKKLLSLIDEEHLLAYIRKMEILILAQKYHINNPYKTLVKWIKNDTRV